MYTIIAARYDSERNLCVTVEDGDGEWRDVWYRAASSLIPPEAIELAEEDERALHTICRYEGLLY